MSSSRAGPAEQTEGPILEIAAASPAEPACAELIAEFDRYLSALYLPEDNHLLSVKSLLQPGVTLVVARAEGSVLGCGAIVRRGREYIEVTRMFVRPGSRGRRIGERILRHLEALGRKEGFALARLETGIRQPEALRLYERVGYRPIPAFGDYAPSDLSLFMECAL
jgi:putative acetyltransferase